MAAGGCGLVRNWEMVYFSCAIIIIIIIIIIIMDIF